MEEKKNIPEIRFKGFEGEWEEVKLGDISDSFDYGLNAAATPYDGYNKYIRITDIDDDSRLFLKNELTSPKTNLDLADKYKLEKNDILFARTGASVGKSYIYKESDGLVYFAGFLIRARINNIMNSYFVFQSTLTNTYNKFVNITSQRSGQPGINAQEYSDFNFKSPDLAEQNKIATLLLNLDKQITLEQQKYDKLITLKKAMLEKMFPKEGKDIPEIRFKGFEEEWEERKLGEISNTYSGGTPSVGNSEFYNGNIPFIRSAEINCNSTELSITELGLKSSSAKMVNTGCILYALYGATSGEVGRSKLEGAINQAILAIMPYNEFDSEFIMQWLRKKKKVIVNTYLQGGQGNLSGSIVKNLNIDLPNFKEQTKIGSFFQSLDKLISLQQKKIDKLKNIKKSCLEKMFV